MPVTSLTVALFAGLVLLPVMGFAQSRVIVKHAYQLERAPAVANLTRDYRALVGAQVLYGRCSKELKITEEQKTYLNSKFVQVAKAYQIAYQDAYVSYIGTYPNQALVDDIAAAIKAQQQRAVDGMTQTLRKWSCRDGRITPVLRYVEELHAKDNAPPEEPVYVEPKAKFRVNH